MFMILSAIVSIGILVFIHEGGHFLAAKAFGVRVTEFMLGLPGPNIGFNFHGTKFGITCIPLGGYARVCGMSSDPLPSHIKQVLAYVYKNGEVCASDVAVSLNISEEEADSCLEELVGWGSIVEKEKKGEETLFKTPALNISKKSVSTENVGCTGRIVSPFEGSPRVVNDIDELFKSEYSKQYRAQSFIKRCVILLAGIAMNLLFAIVAFVVVYSIIGLDVTTASGDVKHVIVDPLRALTAGFSYVGQVFVAILSLFNPQTAADTMSNSTSIVGIAVVSADYFAKGLAPALMFMAMISVSLGLMNLLPIPPLDGGHFIVEVIEKIIGRSVPEKIVGYISTFGIILFFLFFVVMLNQDIQRFVFGNW